MDEQQLAKIRQCPNLPTMPAIAMQVLELTQKPDADIAEIARLISKDAALSGKILRTVNSSFYGRGQNVSTISHALVILGLQSVKTLVLGFSLVNNLAKNQSKGFKHLAYWKRSIFAATAARSIAAKINFVQQEEAFLAALLKDIGMLVLDLCMCEEYSAINARAKHHLDLLQLEQTELGVTHADVSAYLAAQWKLPPLLAVPIGSHHNPLSVSDPTLRKMTDILCIAGHCADVFVNEDAASAIAEVRKGLAALNHLSPTEADALLADIGKRTQEVAPLFDIAIGGKIDYEQILKKANEALVEITLQTQQQSSTLQQQNQVLKHKAHTDGLTGLANRVHFDEVLATRFAAAKAAVDDPEGQLLSLLMLDLDKFKSINDRFGHPAGDAVLKAVAKLLKMAARPQDLAARFGGEEMVMLLPGTAKSTAAAIAETIRRAIAARPIQSDGVSIAVTASIGVGSLEKGSLLNESLQLVKIADLALYNAKSRRMVRNCVRVFSFKPAAKPAVAPAGRSLILNLARPQENRLNLDQQLDAF